MTVINPATEGSIGEVAFGGRADCKCAASRPLTRRWGLDEANVVGTGQGLKKTADLMRERADGIARTLTMEQGKPLAEAKAEVLHSADTFEWFAEEGKRAYGQVIPNRRPANGT